MADEVSSRPQDHGVRVKVLQGVLTPQPPGEQNGKAVNPEVLGEPSVFQLGDVEINQCSQWCDTISGGQHRGRAVDHVPRPYQVIATLVLIAHCFSPRNGERGDKGAGIRLVFVRAEQTAARAV